MTVGRSHGLHLGLLKPIELGEHLRLGQTTFGHEIRSGANRTEAETTQASHRPHGKRQYPSQRVTTIPDPSRSVEPTRFCEGRLDQGEVGLPRSVEVSHALRHRPSLRIGTHAPLRLREHFGEPVDPGRGRVELVEDTRQLDLHEQVDHVIKRSGLITQYRKEPKEKAETRIENLEELVSAARGFDDDDLEEELSPLAAFLSHAVLESGDTQGDSWDDCVQLMTLHSVKGLEFPIVFITGMEDGLFPHRRSLNDFDGLEEERRLCYVGATRAMVELYMTYAEQRRLYGVDSFAQPSRFIGEVPEELLEEIRPNVRVSQPFRRRDRKTRNSPGMEDSGDGVRLGQQVRHKKFGDGVVLNYEGSGAHARVQVNFETAGTKWLVLSYANLDLM